MFTKLLNKLGILTKAQKIEQARIVDQMRRQARSARFSRQAEAVIKSTDVPQRTKSARPTKPTSEVYRRGADTDWQIVGFTSDPSPFSYGFDSGSGSSCSDTSSSTSYDSGSSYSSDSGSSSFSCD